MDALRRLIANPWRAHLSLAFNFLIKNFPTIKAVGVGLLTGLFSVLQALYANDMIFRVNGKQVGGMTELDLVIDIYIFTYDLILQWGN